MAVGLSLQTRRAVLEQMASAYHEAPRAKKRMLLDEFTQTTGYHRTYARWLLNHSEDVLQTVARHPRQPRYGPEVLDVLVQAWNAGSGQKVSDGLYSRHDSRNNNARLPCL